MHQKTACKDCEKRHVGCHATCDEYKQFKKEREEILNRMHEESSFDSFMHDVSTLKRHTDRHRRRDKLGIR